jgi:hypothetical protein
VLLRSVNLVTGNTVGQHLIVPGSMLSNNFNIQYGLGIITILPAQAILTFDESGLEKTYNGLVQEPLINVSPEGLEVSSTYNGSDLPPVNAGQYLVQASLVDPNYLGSIEGMFTINKAEATVTANNAIIRKGYPVPALTSTFAGFVNGEDQSVVTSLTHVINPVYNGAAGIYQIIPAATADNYLFTPVNGQLYVNPYGSGAKNVIVSLVCVEQIPPDENGFTYIAHFKYLNQNTTPVYVQAGIENRLTGAGQYSSVGIPQLFMPGEGFWEVRFNGVKVTWTVKSYKNWTKTTCSAFAVSTSVQCNKSLMVTDQPKTTVAPEIVISVYPNPANDKVFVNLNTSSVSADDVFLFDIPGKQYPVNPVKISDQLIEIDLSAIKSGMYFLRIKTPDELKVFRIIRQ